jgi:hypothetical protein
MTTKRETPTNLRSLTARVENLARSQGRPVGRIQRAVANTVIGQMLPPGVVHRADHRHVRAPINPGAAPQ